MRRRVAIAVVPLAVVSGLALLGSRAEGLPVPGAAPTLAAASCVPTDLGTLGGSQGDAIAISSNGFVTGWAADASGTPQPVLWSSGRPTRIDTGLINVSPTAINSRGEVVGTGVDAADSEEVGWYWVGGRTTRLRAPAGLIAVPSAINDSGRIAGALASDDDGGSEPTSGEAPEQAATWASSASAAHVLPALPGDVGAHVYGLNKNGTMVGNSQGADHFTASVWDATGRVTALPALGGDWGIATAVNDAGVVAGAAVSTTGAQQGMTWDVRHRGHARVRSGGRAVQANGLTNGDPVGQSVVAEAGDRARTQALQWDASGTAVVMPPLPRRSEAGVNAASPAGLVVGFSADDRGVRRPTMWTCKP